MIKNRLKECCQLCPYIEISTYTDKLKAGDECIFANVDIFCEHEKVCKRYIENQNTEDKQ